MSLSTPSPKQKPTTGKHLREPPPSLFLGPPSANASHVSLAPPQPIPNPLIQQRSRGHLVDGASSSSVAEPPAPARKVHSHQDAENKKQADRTDALWAEMQSTLEEVELSDVNGTHVFGQEHARALEELRAAQIGLAQAWARSEADDAAGENESKRSSGEVGGKGLQVGSEGRNTALNTSTVSGGNRPGSSGGDGTEKGIGKMEETQADILLARKRREANDRYFQKVNDGVLDVVAKLEEVAAAMRAVEQESRDIWGETESTTTSYQG